MLETIYSALDKRKYFVAETKIQKYLQCLWHETGHPHGLRTGEYFLALLQHTLRLLFLPFGVLFYALPRYGRQYGVFEAEFLRHPTASVVYGTGTLFYLLFLLTLTLETVPLVFTASCDSTAASLGREKAISFAFVLSFIVHEFGQAKKQGLKLYISNFTNIVDLLMIFLFVIAAVLVILLKASPGRITLP
eukprot:m.179589 g.179589  ORF g.179589 m.179589 type:complete len:191 (+) comp39223_c1_seq2:1730-2302(+)